MPKLTLISIFCCAIFLNACGAGDKPATVSTNKSDAAGSEKIASTDASTNLTGVAACDEYFAKVEKFLDNPNVPPATRDAYRQSLEQNRSAWKQAAATPQGKTQLEASCRAALDSIKPALEQYGK